MIIWTPYEKRSFPTGGDGLKSEKKVQFTEAALFAASKTIINFFFVKPLV